VRIFLGWSGPESKAIALALRDFLKKVCQAFDPWISEMIDKGARWSPAIAEALRESRAGVFVITPDKREVCSGRAGGAVAAEQGGEPRELE
jgi:hypothetical protein